MRDDEDTHLLVNPEPVVPLSPSVYTGPTGHVPKELPTVDPAVAAPAGPCIYTQAKSNRPPTTRT
jgi:hypothetical protein